MQKFSANHAKAAHRILLFFYKMRWRGRGGYHI